MPEPNLNKKFLVTFETVFEDCANPEQFQEYFLEYLQTLIISKDLSLFNIKEITPDIFN
ncbi:hypothetical protein KAR91_66800 [Candidatus Pacearchaeota archaeon]|nr:hypothetical protein [Candidatus Pacearchaeota archaeon]